MDLSVFQEYLAKNFNTLNLTNIGRTSEPYYLPCTQFLVQTHQDIQCQLVLLEFSEYDFHVSLHS